MGGDRQGTAREAQCAREMGCDGIKDTRQTRAVCVDTAIGGAQKSCYLRSQRGEREGKGLALVDLRRAYLYTPALRKVFVELPEDYQGPRVGASEPLCDSMCCGKER